MKILVVEDSDTQALIIQRMLRSQGWEVIRAGNGQEGMKLLRSDNPDIILSDVEMPVIDGFDFCRLVKGSAFKNVPFILLTALGELDHMVKGLDLGADDYITKPVRERELYARLRSFRRMKEYQDQLQDALDEQKVTSDKLAKAVEQQALEMEQAKVTQRSIMPNQMPQVPGIHMVSKYAPMKTIGGDFYDIIQLNENKLGIVVADVAGHGVSAALIAFMASSAFKSHCKLDNKPDETLRAVNEFLTGKIENNKFISVWYGILDLSTKTVSYATAGHPPAFVARQKQNVTIPLVSSGIALGLFPNEVNELTTESVQLEPGDKMLIYTDGIYEMTNDQDQIFGSTRLQKYLLETVELPLHQWIDRLYDYVLVYSGQTAYEDDITLVALEVLEK